MKKIQKLVDVSLWTGNWPFIHHKYRDIKSLKEKIISQNIEKAFISPIEAILEEDPLRANRELLASLDDDLFSPVPVINLSYANWEEGVNLAINDKRVKMVKLLPNYHMYDFDENTIEKLVGITQKEGLLISLQLRIEDSRRQYPLMKIPVIDLDMIIKTISNFPEQVFIINNAYLGEAQDILGSLENTYCDISSLEFHDILTKLYDQFSLDRFLFASHMPFYYVEGNINKLVYCDLPDKEINKVAYANIEKLI